MILQLLSLEAPRSRKSLTGRGAERRGGGEGNSRSRGDLAVGSLSRAHSLFLP